MYSFFTPEADDEIFISSNSVSSLWTIVEHANSNRFVFLQKLTRPSTLWHFSSSRSGPAHILDFVSFQITDDTDKSVSWCTKARTLLILSSGLWHLVKFRLENLLRVQEMTGGAWFQMGPELQNPGLHLSLHCGTDADAKKNLVWQKSLTL